MVARCRLLEDVGSPMHGPFPPPTGDHKGTQPIHPTALAPTESWIDAYIGGRAHDLIAWNEHATKLSDEQPVSTRS
jgi:hypothetical protein